MNKIIGLKLTSHVFMANYTLKDFLDWVWNVENFFDYMDVVEKKLPTSCKVVPLLGGNNFNPTDGGKESNLFDLGQG